MGTRSGRASVSPLRHPLLWVAGTVEEAIRKAPEAGTFLAGLGLAIIGTAVLSGCTLAMALWYSGAAPWVCAIVGVFWFVFIMNLDRVFVATLTAAHPIASMVPRVLLTLLVAVQVAVPLELWVFRDDVGLRLLHNQQAGARSEIVQDVGFYASRLHADRVALMQQETQLERLRTQIVNNK